ncbi:MAG TPA: hypothetical protein VGD59_10250 [Acidisarcina sp.]
MIAATLGFAAVSAVATAQEPGGAPETPVAIEAPASTAPAVQSPAASAPGVQAPTTPRADATVTSPSGPTASQDAVDQAPAQPASPAPKTYTVPAGTKVLLTLQSPINTKSAKPGDGVYLMSAFPVIVGNRVLIPSGMYVQGTVDSVERHIRIKGHAKLNMHFTSMIFPNGSVVEIPGMMSGIPGSKGPKVIGGGEGTVEQTGGTGDVIKAAGKGAEVGVSPGVIVGAVENHPFAGAGAGAVGGALVGAAVSLFTHGNDIEILTGSQVEMVLQRPLILQDSNLSDAAPQQVLVPAAQRQPMAKPNPRRILCPVGSSCQN